MTQVEVAKFKIKFVSSKGNLADVLRRHSRDHYNEYIIDNISVKSIPIQNYYWNVP